VQPAQYLALPHGSVKSRIGWYFQNFGTNRREKSEAVFAKEKEFLDRKQPIYGRIYLRDTEQEVRRADYFPELGYEIQLEYLLRGRGLTTAADAAEVVLAAQGDRILGFAVMAGRQALHYRQTGLTKQISEDDIPIDVRAEEPRRKHGL
jgi:hypothetical protein